MKQETLAIPDFSMESDAVAGLVGNEGGVVSDGPAVPISVRSGHAKAAEKYANRMPMKESVSTTSGARAIFTKSEEANKRSEELNITRSLFWNDVSTRIMPKDGICDLCHTEFIAHEIDFRDR